MNEQGMTVMCFPRQRRPVDLTCAMAVQEFIERGKVEQNEDRFVNTSWLFTGIRQFTRLVATIGEGLLKKKTNERH